MAFLFLSLYLYIPLELEHSRDFASEYPRSASSYPLSSSSFLPAMRVRLPSYRVFLHLSLSATAQPTSFPPPRLSAYPRVRSDPLLPENLLVPPSPRSPRPVSFHFTIYYLSKGARSARTEASPLSASSRHSHSSISIFSTLLPARQITPPSAYVRASTVFAKSNMQNALFLFQAAHI